MVQTAISVVYVTGTPTFSGPVQGFSTQSLPPIFAPGQTAGPTVEIGSITLTKPSPTSVGVANPATTSSIGAAAGNVSASAQSNPGSGSGSGSSQMIIGLCVGLGVLAVLMITAGIFVLRRTRGTGILSLRKKSQGSGPDIETVGKEVMQSRSPPSTEVRELPAVPKGFGSKYRKRAHEVLGDEAAKEMPTKGGSVYEMAQSTECYELPTAITAKNSARNSIRS